MSQRPRKILTALGATLLALGASAVLAVPALANTITVGDLQFATTTESDTIYQAGNTDTEIPADATVISYEDNQATVTGGATGITVTQVMAAEGENPATPVTNLTIGTSESAYAGAITLSNIDSNLIVTIGGETSTVTVALDGCTFTGAGNGQATINVAAECTPTLGLTDSTVTGGAGASGDTANGGPAISFAGNGTLQTTGTVTITGGNGADGAEPGNGGPGITMATGTCTINPTASALTVKGGNGGNASAATDTCGMGGNGIYAPQSKLKMADNSTLTASAGADGTTGVVTPTSVGLTVGKLDLSNATTTNGTGPSITAIGHPRENATNLDLSNIDAGSPDDNTFYPWLLQASTDSENPGENPWVVDFAGDGLEDEPVVRNGWTWFNIAPHPVTGLEAALWTNTQADTDIAWQIVNPMDGSPIPEFAFGVKPTFDDNDLEVNPYEAINGATISGLVYPEGALNVVGPVDEPNAWLGNNYTVSPNYEGTDLAVTGTAVLPDSFTSLYPELNTSLETTFPLYGAQAVYRLYNQYTTQHLYTTDVAEVNGDVEAGWNFEDVSWYAPTSGWTGDGGTVTVIKRLYNPFNGDHYYIEATNTQGIESLTSLGWKEESDQADILSLPATAEIDGYPLSMSVFTLYNRFETVGNHLYTTDGNEATYLESIGWEPNETIIYAYNGDLINPVTAND